MNATNARFWIRWNRDWVKLTLTPGRAVELNTGRLTDEGWEHTRHHYRHDGDEVAYSRAFESLDCDGRFDESYDFLCPLDQLKANDEQDDGDLPGPPLPNWNTTSRRCRDHAAEAAGY